jgi:hypothetical protein
MDGGYCTYTARCRGPRVNRGFYCSDLTADDSGDQSGVDLLIADQLDVGRFDHSVRRLDHRDEPHTFDHSKCFHLIILKPSPFLFLLKTADQQ